MDNSNNYIFGMHPVMEAVTADRKFEKVLLRQGLEGVQSRQLLQLLDLKGIPFQWVPVERLNKLVHGAHQGVVALLPNIEYASFEPVVDALVEKGGAPLIVMLDGVSDVRNFGAIARTCECAGVDAIVVPAKGGAAINADAVKTSAGALLRMPVTKVPSLKMACYYLLESGFRIIAATEKTEGLIYDADFTGPTAIVMGAEDTGVSPAVLALSTGRAKIPMMGSIGSLNVSVATSIVLYEALRQRSFNKHSI